MSFPQSSRLGCICYWFTLQLTVSWSMCFPVLLLSSSENVTAILYVNDIEVPAWCPNVTVNKCEDFGLWLVPECWTIHNYSCYRELFIIIQSFAVALKQFRHWIWWVFSWFSNKAGLKGLFDDFNKTEKKRISFSLAVYLNQILFAYNNLKPLSFLLLGVTTDCLKIRLTSFTLIRGSSCKQWVYILTCTNSENGFQNCTGCNRAGWDQTQKWSSSYFSFFCALLVLKCKIFYSFLIVARIEEPTQIDNLFHLNTKKYKIYFMICRKTSINHIYIF